MGQRQHSLRKVQTVGTGIVNISGNFPSGAAQDGTFPVASLVDGYVATPYSAAPNDGYGEGWRGVIRTGAGRYDIYLDRVYAELQHASGTVFSFTSKSLSVQFTFPLMITKSPDSGEDVSLVRLVIVGASAVDTDLAADERVSFFLVLKNSSAV